MSEQDLRYIEENLYLTNRELASRFNMNERTFKRLLHKHQLRRSEEQMEQIHLRRGEQQRGASNPAWKEGRSSDNYFYRKRSRARHPEKDLARARVHYAKKTGKLITKPCEVCGSDKNIEAHHHKGYLPENALDIIWLCRKHHKEIEAYCKEDVNLEIG